MSNFALVLPAPVSTDPIAQARALAAMAVGLGNRARRAHRMGSVTDRRAAVYVNSLVRHAAQLLQNTSDHDVPVLWPGSQGPGENAAHFVLRHDRLLGPPVAHRFLAVGADAQLRCCVMSEVDGTRLWADYSVTSAPEDLPLRTVLDELSALIAKLEQAVTKLETSQLTRELQLDAEIAAAKARVAGLVFDSPAPSRQRTTSEEPRRPWSRHGRTTVAEGAVADGPAPDGPDGPLLERSEPEPAAAEATEPPRAPAPAAVVPAAPMPVATIPAAPMAPAPQAARPPLPSIVPAARRPLTRLKKTI